MVHTAFNSVSVIEKLPLKIEAIEVWGEHKLLVGTTEGVLFIYEVKENLDNTGKKVFSVSLQDAQKTFSKKPIQQLNVIDLPSDNNNNTVPVLLSLSDGAISAHDLPSVTPRFQINKAKGSHLFAVDTTTTSAKNLRLCVAVKRKLLILTWDGVEFAETKELALPDIAKTIVFCGSENICVGFRKEYNMIHINTGAITELFPTGKSGTPVATLLLPYNYNHTSGYSSGSSTSNSLSQQPQVLLGKDNVSIFIGFNGKPTKKYGLSWSENPNVVGYSYPYAIAVLSKFVEVRTISGNETLVQSIPLKAPRLIANNNDAIYVAAQSHVWRLIPVPIVTQVDQLVKDKEYEEALALCECIPDSDPTKVAKVKSIKILYTYHLFSQGQYERAMEYFSELDCDPLQVIGLYPNLLSRDVRSKYTYPIEVPDLTGAALEKALGALAHYLLQMRMNLNNSRPSPVISESDTNVIHSIPINPASLEEDYGTVTDPATIIDTALLKAYIKTGNDSLLSDLLRVSNSCHIKESEKVLQSYNKYSELVLLYKGKGLHRRALELLSKLGHNVAPGSSGSSSSSNTLNLGVSETIAYLRELGKEQLDLILEFSRWVLESVPSEALTIFTENRHKSQVLPPAQVLNHIKSLSPGLVVTYLEHVVLKQKDTGAEYHNELILIYLETITAIRRDVPQKQSATRVIAGTEPGLLGSTRKKLLSFLEESQYYNPEKMLSRFPFEDLYEERAILLSRIGQHAQALHIYAHKLKDHDMAVKYCVRHYNPEKEESRDVYLSLLRVYLKPPEGAEPMLQPALQLLNNHYQHIDVSRALDLLPSETLITQLYFVFESVLQDNSKTRRNNQVYKNLLKSENLQVREQLIRARSQSVKVGEDRMCPVCNKRLGNSVFACYPNGITVHYVCAKDKNVCPVTKQVFS